MYGKATRPMKEEGGGKRQQPRKKQSGREKGKDDVANYRGGRKGERGKTHLRDVAKRVDDSVSHCALCAGTREGGLSRKRRKRVNRGSVRFWAAGRTEIHARATL
jgi:hypothetical protein